MFRIALCFGMLVATLGSGCRKGDTAAGNRANESASATAAPPADATDCKNLPSDHNTLFGRGADLITPYMNLTDRSAATSPDRKKHLEAGIACLDRVLELSPGHWQSLWIRGKAFQSLGEHQKARASFAAAHTSEPSHPDVARELVMELLELGDFGQAVRIASDISGKHPKDAGLRANLALALVLNGKIAEAKTAVNEAFALDPNDKITGVLRTRIHEVASGKRKRPGSLQEFERDDG